MPAVALAKEGFLVDWYVALLVAAAARNLALDPAAAARFLDDGRWPKVANWTALADRRIDLSSMAPSLLELAQRGPRPLSERDLDPATRQQKGRLGTAWGRTGRRRWCR